MEEVGELALRGLRELDAVAYVRFASVYRKFEDVAEFERELERLESSRRCSTSTSSSRPATRRAEVPARPGPSEPGVRLRGYPLRPEMRAPKSALAGLTRGKFRELEG